MVYANYVTCGILSRNETYKIMSRLTKKFQITLPKPVRQMLDVRSGEEVDFLIDHGGRVQVIRKDRKNPFDKYVGLLKTTGTKDSDRIVAHLRGHKA